MQLNETRPFQFDELSTLERVENTQSNTNNQETESKMIFHYFTFWENKLMKNEFQFLISYQVHLNSPFKTKENSFSFSSNDNASFYQLLMGTIYKETAAVASMN